MNLKDISIENIERMMSDFVDENMPEKTKKLMASYISAIAVDAFYLGYQINKEELKEEITEEKINEIFYGKNANREARNLLNYLTLRISKPLLTGRPSIAEGD